MIKKFILPYIILVIFIFFSLDLLITNLFLKNYGDGCFEIEEYYYQLKKNCSKKDQFKPGFPIVNIYTDELGMRIGKNHLKKKNSKDVLIFGDSMTYGVGLEYEETFIGILEKKIESLNFYNHAVGSYSPSVHLYRLKKTLSNKYIQPKKIIVFLDISDVYDESSRWVYKEDNFKPILITNHWKEIIKKKNKFIKKNFWISNFIASKLNFYLREFRSSRKNNLISHSNKVKTSIQGQFTYTKINELSSYWTEENLNNGISKIKKNINSISDISKKKDIEFFLVIFPWAETIEYGQNEFDWEKFAETLCSNNKCKLINTFPYFRDYVMKNKNWSTDLYFSNDEHFNNKGNIIIANILEKKI